jgi:hypothetical protein
MLHDKVKADMASAEFTLDSFEDLERQLVLLSTAREVEEFVAAVNAYLAGWSTERIENLQKIDGGWGAFDSAKRPKPIHDLAGIVYISDALNNHFDALKEAGLEAGPELLELTLYFLLAKHVAETAPFASARSGTAPALALSNRTRFGSNSAHA